MSGETEKEVSGWTVDTLKQHFDERYTELIRSKDNRFAELKQHGDEATEHLRRNIESVIESIRTLIRARNAMDDQRFLAQEKAIATALMTAEKAVNAALVAAKEAVTKAEDANEKRFASVNEFRATLSDQATQFMTRVEGDARFNAMAEKIGELQQRSDRIAGRSGGLNQGWVYLVSAIGAVLVLGQLAGLLVNLFGHAPPP